MNGSLLIAGTASDSGKSIVTAGICRMLARQGVKVAPFKAQNMALNSAVTSSGAEIGRAQAAQAAAAMIEPQVEMNPILIKPSGERESQVVVMGEPYANVSARSYQDLKTELKAVVRSAYETLSDQFDVVICEGAGSPAEINLRDGDLANMGLARLTGMPVLVVGDIDRGGVFASLYGTLALLDRSDQALVAGFLINKFRGDQSILSPGLDQVSRLTGRPVLGVLPWMRGLWLDVEDSLALEAPRDGSRQGSGEGGIEVAVVRLRWMSNFTDFDALTCEPGVNVRFTQSASDIARADLVVLPGTKATVEDLAWLRSRGLDVALAQRAKADQPILGICGGYQMLGTTINDDVESCAGEVPGLGLLPVETRFAARKTVRQNTGISPVFRGAKATGYEIRHGQPTRAGGEALIIDDTGADEGCVSGTTIGTSWHGLLESDLMRRELLSWVAAARNIQWQPGTQSFATVRENRLDALGDLIADNIDQAALHQLIDNGAPTGLPAVTPYLESASQHEPHLAEVAAR